ncbi:hypothetical protein NST99_10265 [Paenibacillus sp. FSL L8-0470]|uniref:hypothetical protein n=1 Tax=Paenibacillus sp. FSL L8-0470 TaxID=2954688 RepID=UPI0030FAE3A6
MKNKFITRIRAISQVVFIVILHLFVIHIMDLKVGKWEEEGIRHIFIVYSVLIILLYVTCMMSLVTKKLKYNLIWFCISTIPSISILFFLNKIQGNNVTGSGFIDFKFDDGFVELMILFPFSYLLIQLALVVALWIFKFPKNN